MELVNIPASFPLYWGQNAVSQYIRAIPVNSQIGITNGAASLETGFPPDTFSPAGAGGVPPFGQDFNGITRQLSQWAQWYEAGAPVAYDSVFSTAVGGYPEGALVRAASLPVNWLNLADNNTSNPDSGGSSWIAQGGGTTTIASASTVDLGTTWAYVVNVTGTTAVTALGTLPAGVTKVLIFGGTLTLTYNATSLIVPGAANITTAAGDVAVVTSLGSGNWKCIAYLPVSGQALVPAAAGSIANSQLANMAAKTVKGNAGATSASPSDLTQAQLTALINAFVGDTGSGGTLGAVPAPAATQGAAKAYLCADGTWEGAPLGAVDHWGLPTRSLGTTYQNLTSRPIQVSVTVNCTSSASATFQVSTDGTNWISINQIAAGAGAAVQGTMGGIIPPNVYYRVSNSGGTLVMWAELT